MLCHNIYLAELIVFSQYVRGEEMRLNIWFVTSRERCYVGCNQ